MALPDPSSTPHWRLETMDQSTKMVVWVGHVVPRAEALAWVACTIPAVVKSDPAPWSTSTPIIAAPLEPDPLARTLADSAPPSVVSVQVPAQGGRWDGTLVVRRSDKDGVSILVLEDQRMLKVDTATGAVLATKTPGYQVQEAKDAGPGGVTIKPTSRQGGPGAPRSDPDTVVNPNHILTEAMLAAKTPAELVTAALDSGVTRGRLVDWALEVRALVPVLKPIAEDKIPDRIARALVVLGAGS